MLNHKLKKARGGPSILYILFYVVTNLSAKTMCLIVYISILCTKILSVILLVWYTLQINNLNYKLLFEFEAKYVQFIISQNLGCEN